MAEIRINATGELKLYDSDDSNYVSFKSAGTVSSDVTWTLPSADGSSGQMLSTNGSGTLSWATPSSADPSSADGDSLGTASAEWSDLYLADGGTIQFGNDQEVRLIHTADTGLILKHTATADDKPISLTLQTGETDIAVNDVIGKIDFQAPDEGTGTDAILVAAGIEAVSEGDFSSSNNATKLSFKTAASEAAAEKMSLSSAGLLTIADDLVIGDGKTIGTSSDADSITIASNGVVTFSQAPVFPDGSIAVADLDIDGATDIGAAIVDADLFVVDDGAGGTNRKVTASRLKTYAGFGVGDITGATALAEQPAADDEIAISDGGSLKRLDIKHIQSTPLFSAYHNTTQVISNDSATQVAFNTESNAGNGGAGIDSDGKFASNVFTPTVAGYYFVKFGTTFALTDNEAVNIYIRRNSSSAYRMETRSTSSGTQTNGFQSSGILYLDSDDTCDVTIYVTNDDVTLNGLSSDTVYTYFQGWRLTGV